MKPSARALLPLLAVVATLFSPASSAQTLYKCQQEGKTVYQGQPCPADAKQDTLRAKATSVDAGRAADLDRTIDFMATYRVCADAVQVWGQEMAAPYADWRTRNAKMVSRVENDKQLQTRYEASVEAKRKGKPGMCRDVALELRGQK